jgi:hypothetical protein
MQHTESQNRAILAHLRAGKTITPEQAIQLFGCFRLSARIHNLREMLEAENKGETIHTERVAFVNKYGHKGTFGRYSLIKK